MIITPLLYCARWTGIVECASAKILFEKHGIRTIHIPIAVKIAVANSVSMIAGIRKHTPSEISFEQNSIGTIHIIISIKVSFTFTGIGNTVKGINCGNS